jgi:hypothetical protein
MYTAVILIKRKAETSREAFIEYYRNHHGPLMVSLMEGKGLVSYEQLPVDDEILSGMYLSPESKEWDAVSIYSFEDHESCEKCWAIPEVIEDSKKCMDQQTMLILPTLRYKLR